MEMREERKRNKLLVFLTSFFLANLSGIGVFLVMYTRNNLFYWGLSLGIFLAIEFFITLMCTIHAMES